MTCISPYDYHYGNEADQYTFYRLPKALFTNKRYKKLSDSAKLLYGFMLDRMSLSSKNGWLDDQNRVFIIFTLESVQEAMNCKHEKAVKLLAELDTVKGVGLIERIKRGQGKPSIIYVRKFIDTSDVQTSENQKFKIPDSQKSRVPKNRSQDFRESESNNTNINNTDLSNTDMNNINLEESPSIHQSIGDNPVETSDAIDMIDISENTIRKNIEYDILIKRHKDGRVEELFSLMMSIMKSKKNLIRISGEDIAASRVREQFLKINQEHFEYALDSLKQSKTPVRNMKSYLLTTLYNAPMTMENYYQNLVNHNYYGYD